LSTPGSGEPLLVSDLGEHGLIDRIRGRLGAADPRLAVGIGDDAAVAVPERCALQVLTTDALVEGVHFDRRFSSLSDVGYKALAVNVSDVAAMGGSATLALLSLMLPSSTTVADVDALLDGFLDLAGELRVSLAGGNITRSPGPLVIDVTVSGHVRRRKLLRRGDGRAGQALYVTGSIGAAAAGLGWLDAQFPVSSSQLPASGRAPGAERRAPSEIEECVARYRRPAPRARLGSILGRTGAASACMDLSDGLADAVTQIAEASGTGARIDAEALPIHSGARNWFASLGIDPVTASVAGGDDYELLFAVPKRIGGRLRTAISQGRGVPVTRIGELTSERAVVLRRDGRDEPLPRGFVHF
jgi:thiamine-monophosphate kinase